MASCRELSQQALTARELGHPREAENLLAQAIESCPFDSDARRYYADVLLERGATQEALGQLEYARRLARHDTSLTVQAGEIYLAHNDLASAARRANQAIDMDPASGGAWALRGRVKMTRGNHEAALADLLRSLGHRPDDRRVMQEVAQLYLARGEPDRALIHLQTLTDGSESEVSPRLYELLGHAYAAIGRHAEAGNSYQLAIQRGQPSAELLFNLADAYRRSGQFGNARAAAHEALALQSDHAPSRQLLTQLPTPAHR